LIFSDTAQHECSHRAIHLTGTMPSQNSKLDAEDDEHRSPFAKPDSGVTILFLQHELTF